MENINSNIQESELREQDRWLPIANVARLMKGTLPVSAKVSKDAKECMQECVSEFISFVTSEASDRCLKEKRKTINGEDILYSMHDLGFENYAEVLKIYLAKYREQQALKQERNESRATKRQKKSVVKDETVSTANTQDDISSSSSPTQRSVTADEDGSSHFMSNQNVSAGSTSVTVDGEMHSVMASNGSVTNSIDSPESFFRSYGSNEPEMDEVVGMNSIEENKEVKKEVEDHGEGEKDEIYQYNEYMRGADANISQEHHINDLTKDLSTESQGIDSLSPSIANENANEGYY